MSLVRTGWTSLWCLCLLPLAACQLKAWFESYGLNSADGVSWVRLKSFQLKYCWAVTNCVVWGWWKCQKNMTCKVENINLVCADELWFGGKFEMYYLDLRRLWMLGSFLQLLIACMSLHLLVITFTRNIHGLFKTTEWLVMIQHTMDHEPLQLWINNEWGFYELSFSKTRKILDLVSYNWSYNLSIYVSQMFSDGGWNFTSCFIRLWFFQP